MLNNSPNSNLSNKCYFLVSEQESNQRNRHRRGLFTKPPPPMDLPSETKGREFFNTAGENVPIFAHPASEKLPLHQKIGTFSDATVPRYNTLQFRRCVTGDSQEGVFGARERDTQRLLSRLLLVLFLAKQEKDINLHTRKKSDTNALSKIPARIPHHLRAKSRPSGGCAPKRACGRSLVQRELSKIFDF